MSNPNKLEQQKQSIKNLIASMVESLPLPVLTMITCYRGTIDKAVDNLTEEQIAFVINEAKKLIATLECDDGETVSN